MTKNRLEAFSDGVMAVIITIMVLEVKVPHGDDLHALADLCPVLIGYVLSFVYVAIYWNNHHHLLHATKQIGGAVMWANMHLLFWISLIPVTTGWVGEHPLAPWPTAFYGAVLTMAGVAWMLLERAIIARNGPGSELAEAVGHDWKATFSGVVTLIGVGLAFVRPWISDVLYALVAVSWVVPDPRIEKRAAAQRATPD